jgi:hypothetical protein
MHGPSLIPCALYEKHAAARYSLEVWFHREDDVAMP